MSLRVLPLVFFIAIGLTAQEKNFKFRKVSKEEVQQTHHALEKDAEAAILYKKERVFYDFDANNGFRTMRDARYRIKIYNKSGLDWGTIEVPLYTSKNGEERISSIKGYTYNLVNGKVVEAKLKKDGIFIENVSKYRNKASIAMPEIREGSVIDIEYRISSDFAGNIDDFKFQYGIPVDRVEVSVEIPEYYIFKRYGKGFYPISIEQSKKSRQIDFNYRPEFEAGMGGKGRSKTEIRKLDFFENVYKVNAQNIPSLKEVDFTDNIDNYRSAIKFELASTRFPNRPYKNYNLSWEDVAKSIYKYDDFGGELKKERVIRDVVDQLKAEASDKNALALKIFEHVKNRMTWNKYTGVGCENGIKKAYEEKTGNVADINLMLTVMLRYAGFNANPVLVSTKSHGIPLFPTNDGFNYVVSAIENGESYTLLDATEKMGTMNVLPLRALNWKGRLIREDGSSIEIDLAPKKPTKRLVFLSAQISEDGTVEGKMRKQLTDGLALNYRKSYKDQTLEEIMEHIENRYVEMEMDEFEIKNQEVCSKPVVEVCSFVMENQVESISNKLYFRPALFLSLVENPFKMETREYPVDMEYPRLSDLTVNFQIPEDYVVESIPENMALALPDGLGSFKYSIKQNGNMIQFRSTTAINKAIIPPNYYQALKEFYNQLVSKQAERIVLAKA